MFRVVDPVEADAYEGEASLSAIAGAARDVALYADNFNASEYARTEAFDEAIARVEEATGVRLKNPMYARPVSIPTPLDLLAPSSAPRDDPFAAWNRRVDELAVQHADKAEIVRSARLGDIEAAARGKATSADRRLSALSATRPTLGGFSAAVAGGIGGALQDPLTIATLPIGVPGAGGKTLASKVLSSAWREAVVSGGVEAAMQPKVQKWRADAGLESGFGEAAANVAGATLLGGALGGALRGVIETPAALRARQAKAPPADTIARDLEDVRPDLPPELRAASDVMEQERAVTAAIRAEHGDAPGADLVRAMEAGDRLAETAGTDMGASRPFQPRPTPRRTVQRPQSLTEFLAGEGLRDQGGELAAAGLDKVVVPGSGRLVRKTGGLPLDRAREAAAEAGFLRGFGSREDAMANSTVDDLLSALREEQGGTRLHAMADDAQAETWGRETEGREAHARDERLREDIHRVSDGQLSDAEAERALRLARGGMDADEAVERVVMYEDTSSLDARPEPFEPGSSEFEQQLAALEADADPDAQLSDMVFADEAGGISVEARTLAEALEEADRGVFLSQLVEACKTS